MRVAALDIFHAAVRAASPRAGILAAVTPGSRVVTVQGTPYALVWLTVPCRRTLPL